MPVNPGLERSRLEEDEFKANLGFLGEMVLKGGGGGTSTEIVIKSAGEVRLRRSADPAMPVMAYADCNRAGCRVT